MRQMNDVHSRPAWYAAHARLRTDCYVLIAALLTRPPSVDLIRLVRDMCWDEDLSEKMHGALAALNKAGKVCSEDTITAEFNRLFVGLGSGELVPYGSWYLEKMIQSAPLAAIRTDLGRLGIVRQSASFESEDHAGALCEIMALLSDPASAVAKRDQGAFFDRHMAPWLPHFFNDLQTAGDAPFYQRVGEFANCFLEAENDYFHDRSSSNS